MIAKSLIELREPHVSWSQVLEATSIAHSAVSAIKRKIELPVKKSWCKLSRLDSGLLSRYRIDASKAQIESNAAKTTSLKS